MNQITPFNLPTEIVDLPSKGLLYPSTNPLSSGKIEMKYMTAKEEDILTNQSYIEKGIVVDKLLQSMIISKINYDDLFIGDKNAIMIAARILSYGKDYVFTYDGIEQNVDLSLLESKEINESLFSKGINEFNFIFPETKNEITFKLLTHKDDNAIDQELKGLKKINKDASSDITTRLSYMITSINGSREKKDIRDFINNYLLAKDARAFRKYYNSISPDVNLDITVINSRDEEEVINLPITLNFFWPDSGI